MSQTEFALSMIKVTQLPSLIRMEAGIIHHIVNRLVPNVLEFNELRYSSAIHHLTFRPIANHAILSHPPIPSRTVSLSEVSSACRTVANL
ncbi:hypothetical protein NPIL_602001 [Nephila pilipes]|uniref:Uncharacterized protein n=1 Tax=Nephila pilipes TaxID=299642 RepID=A0A8X6TJD8_NEPPI|nr:hypothetical protein NPIL_602001 [Nephila pilipes]